MLLIGCIVGFIGFQQLYFAVCLRFQDLEIQQGIGIILVEIGIRQIIRFQDIAVQITDNKPAVFFQVGRKRTFRNLREPVVNPVSRSAYENEQQTNDCKKNAFKNRISPAIFHIGMNFQFEKLQHFPEIFFQNEFLTDFDEQR